MTAQTVFITGTDTGVGKTYVACGVIRLLRERGVAACGFKPIACGDRDDAEALASASEIADLSVVNPVHFETAVTPSVAAGLENRELDRCAIFDGYEVLCSKFEAVVIEGAGGWEVPMTGSTTMADLAVELAAPVMVVAANRLGALNHSLLTVRAVQDRGLKCIGVLLNEIVPRNEPDPAADNNLRTLKEFLPGLPVSELGFETGEIPETMIDAILSG